MAIATNEQQVVEKVQNKLFIGGEWRDASGGGTLEVIDPATEEPLCEIADGTPEDAMAALDAAVEMQGEWAATAPNDRAGILWKAFETLTERADELALLMTLEMGKPVAESKAEIVYAADFFRWFSGEALRIEGNYKQFANGTSRVLVMKQPVGPSLMITPWNFPMAMGTRKVGPALAAGCTSVMKPAQQTPLCMLALGQILEEAGLPGGVFNIVTTSSSGKTTGPLIKDPRLRKLSFTGSTEVGRKLIEASAEQVLKVSMELGGNAPFLIFDDADLDAAVDGALLAKMRNIGEACTSANRFHVAEPVQEEFQRRLAEKMGALKLGGVPEEARVFKEEIFGPVAPVGSFASEEEAIARANDTEYGLVAYVFTRDIKRAIRVCEGLETGMVGLNQGMVSNAGAPFGGVKQSGIGREGGQEGLEEFLETKYVAVNL